MQKKKENAPKDDITYWELFITFLKINALTFGGGYTIVPVIRDEFIYKKKLLEEEQMLDLVALAQSGPGPMAINASLLTGYRMKGPMGAVVSLVASVLPCLVILSIVYYIYDAIRDNRWVQSAFSVMGGAISAVLLVTTFDLARTALRKHRIFGVVLMVGAFVASYFFSVNTALIILVCGLIGLTLFAFVDESKVM